MCSKKDYKQQVRFIWASGLSAASGLAFTSAYAILIIVLLRGTVKASNFQDLIFLFTFFPAGFSLFGAVSYHFAYKSFIEKEPVSKKVLEDVIDHRFDHRSQLIGLIMVLVFLTIVVFISLMGMASILYYYIAILTSLSYIITVLAYNLIISYIIVGNIQKEVDSNEDWGRVFNLLYIEDK